MKMFGQYKNKAIYVTCNGDQKDKSTNYNVKHIWDNRVT